ncbi:MULTISPECIES: phage head closure protein [Bacillus]|uniref:Phage head-tail adapter protein n=1 Tax=Bacillus zhangzhouensis TaxID=1178540 RepID=A0A081L6A1_9BACI|nr:phage head closure protein [Bacillus zhangzhouensis]KEP24777.1 phage head-tail adapter protein [Bacillus zhangzhouensis]
MKKISKLNRRLIFQKKNKVQDEELNWNEAYENVFETWGSIEGFSGSKSDTLVAGALGVKSPKKITIRYREDVAQDMRILHQTGSDEAGEPIYRTFDVMDYNDIENKKKQLEITCNEVGVNG